ncbi:hypothetical protein [Gluconobacter cerinus]|uniref:hypothetical protein n=1 Tax=Gluconobacter cerinus TaxID=38307 RepID=UPI001B8ADB1A|nr:hypothetical protein [Gluconobacter cerinus]MBS1032991.1 hypothetical protein [Gluconobacter cerinus]
MSSASRRFAQLVNDVGQSVDFGTNLLEYAGNPLMVFHSCQKVFGVHGFVAGLQSLNLTVVGLENGLEQNAG